MSPELANAFLAYANGLPLDPSIKPLVLGIGSLFAFLSPSLAVGLLVVWFVTEVKRFARSLRS
jgi:hypothetical protein